MNYRDRIVGIIFDAMRESNASAEPGRTLEISEATVLVGESGKLDSLGFVNLVASIEEHIERTLHRAVSVMDVILAVEGAEWTAAALAEGIAATLPHTEGEDMLAGSAARG